MFSGVHSVHFIGIAGTAMAAAAAAMRDRGFLVTGSDKPGIYPPMSTFLEERSLAVMKGHFAGNLEPRPDLVVIGNALSRGNAEVEAVLNGRIPYCSLPELLKAFFIRGKRPIVICGTHGKTTTTSLMAWVLQQNGLDPSYLIGGMPPNLNQGAKFSDGEWFVIEGDEYDTAFFDKRSKFVHYLPEIAVINNLEFDHADIFANLEAVQASFRQLVRLMPENGVLFANGDDPNLPALLQEARCPVRRFGFGEGNDLRIGSCGLTSDGMEFALGEDRFRIGLTGEFNVRNAAAVAGVARHCGLSDSAIQSGFDTFNGIKRRMEVLGEPGGIVVIDDFGHHPTAIRETLRALRQRYPERRLWALFEPRSNTTRRKVFQRELAEALSEADAVVVSEIARLAQLSAEERLDPQCLIDDLRRAGRLAFYLPAVEEIVRHVALHSCRGDVVCVFSNGDFGNIHERLLRALAERGERVQERDER